MSIGSTDYQACVKQVFELKNQVAEKQAEWIRRILFLSVTLFGILVSLHTSAPTNPGNQWCFAVACVALALGILLLSIASYHHIAILSRLRSNFAQEIHNAVQQSGPVKIVQVDTIKFFSICEVGAYICLLFAVLLLATYSLLMVL